MSDIDDRLRRLENRAALDDLVVRYFLAADGDDLEGVGASFTDDATFSSSGHLNARGRTAIVDFIAGARTQMGLTVHTPNYALFNFDGDDAATGLIGAHLELVLGGKSIFGAVRYQDSYVLAGDRWLISSRDMRTIYIAPWREVGAALESDLPVHWPGLDPLPSDYPRRHVGGSPAS